MQNLVSLLRRWARLVVIAVWLSAVAPSTWGVAAETELWLYYPTNLLVAENIDRLEAIWRRAAQAGYTHVLLTDSKFCRLEEMPQGYFQNVARVKKLADELKLEIVPAVLPIGWSNDILSRDPNLAEGLPIRDALYVVQQGEARLVADPPVALRGGDMENLKAWNWVDEMVQADNGAALVQDCPGKNARLVQKVRVAPYRQYRVSVRVRTENFTGTPEVKALAPSGYALTHTSLNAAGTQDWKTHTITFNSLDQTEVNIYLGAWGGGAGKLWWDDARLEEVGLLNVLRRPGAPVTVRRENVRQPLVEGQDFQPIADPHLGNHPWAGEYTLDHAPPVIRCGLPDGTRLRVSGYHMAIIYTGSVMISISEPKALEVLQEHVRRVHQAFGARRYFMSHDEIRLFGWDEITQQRQLDAGPLLADHVQRCAAMVRKIAPGCQLYIWSDMFDPHHNAHKDYYLVKGDLAGSWEGLDKEITVACWYYEKRAESLKFFAERGHNTLIAGYYDAPVDNVRQWLDAARAVPGPHPLGRSTAVMYTTWQNRYDDIEAFARAVQGK